ncbi:MAG: F0F1 ATP synthase subunit B [Acidimicrobiales bacterium]|jgi:F-type H+-transporting ATPase subunit b|nr:F0F1 ATP synthase subunit B [Acidimicrobiales bacterium]
MTRRIRQIAGALGLTGTLLVLLAAPAAASGESIGGCAVEAAVHAEEEYGSLHAVEEDKKLFEELEKEMEGCLEAPSPIIPEVDEIIWGGAAFLVLFFFMVWKGMPAVQGAMKDRADKIASDLDAADTAKSDAAKIKADHEAALAGAKSEANQIIEDARAQADQLKAELTARANEEVAEMRTRAAADADAARSQALNDLRGDVSEIAIGAAERVIGSNLDRDAQSALVDAYIDEVARG